MTFFLKLSFIDSFIEFNSLLIPNKDIASALIILRSLLFPLFVLQTEHSLYELLSLSLFLHRVQMLLLDGDGPRRLLADVCGRGSNGCKMLKTKGLGAVSDMVASDSLSIAQWQLGVK